LYIVNITAKLPTEMHKRAFRPELYMWLSDAGAIHTETHFIKVDDSDVVEAVHVSVETVVDGRRPVKTKLSMTRFSSTVITFEFHSPSYVDQTFHARVVPSDNQSTSASVWHRLHYWSASLVLYADWLILT